MRIARGAVPLPTLLFICWAIGGCSDYEPVQPGQTSLRPQPGEYVLVRVSSYGLPYPILAGSVSTSLLEDTLTLEQANEFRHVWRIRHRRGSEGSDSTSTSIRTGYYVQGSDQRGPLIELRGALHTSQVVGPPSQWADAPVIAVATDFGLVVYAPSRWQNGEIDLWEYRTLTATAGGPLPVGGELEK